MNEAALSERCAERVQRVIQEGAYQSQRDSNIDVVLPGNDGRGHKGHDENGGRVGYLGMPGGTQIFHVGAGGT